MKEMQRRILIVDDHDDLKTALGKVFSELGFFVKAVENRSEAVELDRLTDYDLVITDLDGEIAFPDESPKNTQATCLPKNSPDKQNRSAVKAFKICATHFRRDDFREDELKNLFDTVLNYKAMFLDKSETVRHIREKIEFDFPSTLSLLESIIEYLIQRVAKVGVVDPKKSNLYVALDEAFVNAVKHGNKFDANKIIRIAADVSPQEARFTIEDEGEGFDINEIPDPCDPENLFKASGRGVLFIRNIMDEVSYNERGNRVTMVKKNDEKTT